MKEFKKLKNGLLLLIFLEIKFVSLKQYLNLRFIKNSEAFPLKKKFLCIRNDSILILTYPKSL